MELRSEVATVRVPTKSIIVRQDYPPEEPEWSPAEYTAALAVQKFYEMGDADIAGVNRPDDRQGGAAGPPAGG